MQIILNTLAALDRYEFAAVADCVKQAAMQWAVAYIKELEESKDVQ